MSAVSSSPQKVWEFSFLGLESIEPAKGHRPMLRLGFSSLMTEGNFISEANFNETGNRGGFFGGIEQVGGKIYTYFHSTQENDSTYHQLLDILSSAVKSDVSIPKLVIKSEELDASAKTPFIPAAFRKY